MGVISTQGFTFRLLAGTPYQQLDLFKDEDYIVSNNVTGIFDLGLLPSDFTRQLTLPGTKINDAFFQHCYDISIVNPYVFRTNVKIPALFEFDSVNIVQGYIQLNKVNVIANKFIDSYEVSLFGNLSSFSKDANNKFLTNLTTLTKYNHTASFANISSSWNGNLFNGDIVYPLADYGQGIRFSNEEFDYGINTTLGAMQIMDFKPAIRLKKLWDGVFEELGYTYSSKFWEQPWINDVYLFCNYGLKYPEYSDINLETYGLIKISNVSGSFSQITLSDNVSTILPFDNTNYDPQGFMGQNATYNLPINTSIAGNLNLNLFVSNSVNNLPVDWYIKMYNLSSTATYDYFLPNITRYFTQLQNSRNTKISTTVDLSESFVIQNVPAGSYKFMIFQQKLEPSLNSPLVILDPSGSNKSYVEINKLWNAGDDKIMDIAQNLPYGTAGIKLIDFIRSVQKKFNLVISADNTKLNHFKIETFNDWYKKGKILDFNKYINLDDKIEILPANNFAVNQLNLGDTLDTDYISQQFFKGNNREYGKVYYIDTNNYFSQGTFDVKTGFGNGPLALVENTGLSGSASGLIPSITTYFAGNYAFTNVNNPQAACASSDFNPIYTIDGTIGSGKGAYANRYGSSLLTGYYYFTDGTDIWQINPLTGVIGSIIGQCIV